MIVPAVLTMLIAIGLVGWFAYEAIMDFVVQPCRDRRGRRHHWCAGCDKHDVCEWDMAWTDDNGRWWCRKCRTGKAYAT